MNKQIYKDKNNRLLSGVISGLIKSYNLDINIDLARIIFVVLTMFSAFPIVIYIVAAIILPYKNFE